MALKHLRCSDTKPLLGIETEETPAEAVEDEGCSDTKPLLGIETLRRSYLHIQKKSCSDTKPLLGIETDEEVCWKLRITVAATLNPF